MINSITISGFRGFGSDVVVSLPKPNGDLGSGLFMLVGPNNSGKTSFTECFRLFNYPYSQLPTLSSDKCNSKKDGFVEITIDVVNQGRFTLQSDRQGSFLLELLKDGVKYSSEAPFEPRVFVMQSRRYFEHYFGRNENDDKSANSRAQQFTSRSYRLEQFEQRLFKMHKEHELFNDLLTELYGERIEWSLVQNPSQQYQLQIGERTLARTTEGVGDGILSLFTVCDLLYDSNEGDTLIIDEPELSLHPALQKRVMDVLLKFSETRQIILSTHSPYFISIESLTNGGMIGRAHLIDGDIQIGVLTNKTGKKLYSVSQNLNNPHIFGLDAKEVFFLSDGVVLVEGQEDVVVLRRFEIELGKKVAGTLYGWGVGGAGNFSLFMQLLKELGFKKVTAILDGNMEATAQALSSKYPEYQVFTIVTDDIRDKSPRTISEKSGYATTDGKLKEQYRSDAQRLMEKIQAYQTSENFITELNDLEISVL